MFRSRALEGKNISLARGNLYIHRKKPLIIEQIVNHSGVYFLIPCDITKVLRKEHFENSEKMFQMGIIFEKYK
jgi:hypothetical protein